MIDLHCHILPGIDDGAGRLSDSIEMAQALISLGVHHVCCTPHLPWSTFTRSEQEIHELRQDLQRVLWERDLDLNLHVGAEHHFSVVGELMMEGNLVCYPRGDTFLMEFPLGPLPPKWDDLFFRLQVKKLMPVLAHVERYPDVQKDVKLVEKFKERGCAILVNMSSLVGGWDRSARHVARELVRAGLVDAVNTDMHRASQIDSLREGLAEVEALVGEAGRRRLCWENPARLAGIPIEAAP